jgi:hypothetical protein
LNPSSTAGPQMFLNLCPPYGSWLPAMEMTMVRNDCKSSWDLDIKLKNFFDL